ncbi:MAG: hypothetical protein IPK67_13050 [Planctomycetes bacterium]|nr:hypothetical protein [Planctomycetota bacterium]
MQRRRPGDRRLRAAAKSDQDAGTTSTASEPDLLLARISAIKIEVVEAAPVAAEGATVAAPVAAGKTEAGAPAAGAAAKPEAGKKDAPPAKK